MQQKNFDVSPKAYSSTKMMCREFSIENPHIDTEIKDGTLMCVLQAPDRHRGSKLCWAGGDGRIPGVASGGECTALL